MRDAYIITVVENRVKVQEYVDGTLTLLKNRGEEEQAYDELQFWSWFKEKIEYQDEELSFVVITDNKEFLIPDSAEIKLHEKSSLDNDSYINDKILSLAKNLFVLSFPNRIAPEPTTQKEPQKVEPKIEEPLSENAVAGYFRKQTQEFKNE